MVATVQYWFEDFIPGRQFSGTARALDDAAFRLFAQMTGDAHPIHYDAEYAKKTPFGKPLAHGLLLMSMTALGASPLSAHVEDSMVAFLEQGGKFLKPVLVGDTVTPLLEVEETRPTSNPANGIVRFAARLTNQRGEAVLAGFHTYLIKRRPA
jgi:3-hydroxybutyryl-CoA dehydratase